MSQAVLVVIGLAVLTAVALVLRGGSSGPSIAASPEHDADPEEFTGSERRQAMLEELEFDRASGKLSEPDYAALKAKLESSVGASPVAALPQKVAAAKHAARDDAAGLVARLRADQATCPSCGPRPEPGARYCSSCGRYLHACAACGERPDEIGARFCSDCGTRLAA